MANGRIYSVGLAAISVTNDADQDILEMVNGSSASLTLLELRVTSSLTTDERVQLRILRRSTTGSGGTAATESAIDGNNSVTANCAVSYLVTTPGTAGAVLAADHWSQLSPYRWVPTPKCEIVVPPGGRLALNLATAVGATRTWSVTAVWEEY